MINRSAYKGSTWIDLDSPTAEEARQVMDEFHIDPRVMEEIVLPSLKPKVEHYRDFIYLILHFPLFRHTHRSTPNQEIDFIIGRRYLVTVRYDPVEPLHNFAKLLEVQTILDHEESHEHAGMLFYHMIRRLYAELEYGLDFLRDELTDIEAKIFEGKEKEMVVSLSQSSRSLLNFKQSVGRHRTILESFDSVATRFFGDDFSHYSKVILGQQYRIHNDITAYLDSLSQLRETNNSLLSTKENEIMKTLTIMAFVTFPLTLIAAIFSMDTIHTPLIGNPFDFWIVIGGMATATIIFFSYFKYKGWL